MSSNRSTLHVVEDMNQVSISVEDIYEVTECLTLPMGKQKRKTKGPSDDLVPSMADLEWPPEEEEFVIALDEQEWNLGSVQGYSQETNEVHVQILAKLKTRAKMIVGKLTGCTRKTSVSVMTTRRTAFLTYAHLFHWLRILKGKSQFFHC